MDRYVVMGNPVAHSLSPEIHAFFARATGHALHYERMPVPLGEFAAHARRFFEAGGRGANVTLPFKVDAFEFADEASARATLAGAANVLARRGDGAIAADNTDGAGLVRDLTVNLGRNLEGARVVILGAGGAARGVVAPLLALSPERLAIANRTGARARALAERFAARGPVEAIPLDAAAGRFDLLVNATSSSTRGQALDWPRAWAGPGTLAYDMGYGEAAQGFLRQARAAGADAADGLGMLVEQAAESFLAWRGVRPPTAQILEALRARVA